MDTMNQKISIQNFRPDPTRWSLQKSRSDPTRPAGGISESTHKISAAIYSGVIWSRVKITSHSKSRVSLQTKRNIAAGCVRTPRWVFPAAMTHHTSHAIDTRFSLHQFPADTVAAARHPLRATGKSPVFPFVEYFAVSQQQQHCQRGS